MSNSSPRLRFILCSAATFLSVFPGFGLPARAHAQDFPEPPDTQPVTVPLLSAQESLARMELPAGFKATVFAAEPDLNNPIASCWDSRGRLWVAENFTYGDSRERYNLNLRDRILILEDTDGDGRHDKRTVFTDKIQMLTSIERGLGGVWAVAPPHLLFIPDADGDDVPDGPPQVMLDGFSTQAASHHTFANGLKWGPDGWLYGRIGISSTSFIGTPGTPQKDRAGTAGGLWRYHPGRRLFDIVCAGTTNPWGHDWDRHGELFFINTVIGHLWHGIHGAHFKRMFGEDLNPRTYALMDMIADHWHWDTGKTWQDSREAGAGSDAMGGGHAHVGMIIYQGLNWPADYRDKLMTINFGGRRVNVERLERRGAGYTGRHEPDILKTADPWFRGTGLTCGPDGGVYLLDWSDIGECHDSDGIHRNSGRIYKITYGDAIRPAETSLESLSAEALVRLQTSPNEWLVRHARQELSGRVLRGTLSPDTVAPVLLEQFRTSSGIPQKLNQWWTLHTAAGALPDAGGGKKSLPVTGNALAEMERSALRSGDPYLTSWLIRLHGDEFLGGIPHPSSPGAAGHQEILRDFGSLAAEAGDPAIRLALASALVKLPPAARAPLASALLMHGEDATDASLPLMYWYGIMDLPPSTLAGLFAECRIPLVRRFIARRCTEDVEAAPGPLNDLLTAARHPEELLSGMTEALRGWSRAAKPAAWDTFTGTLPAGFLADRPEAASLGILFGDGRALAEIRALALNDQAPLISREKALRSLVTARPDDLRAICEKLIGTRSLSVAALSGLALFDEPSVGKKICQNFAAFYPAEKPAALDVLTSRKTFAAALLDHIGPRGIPRDQLTAVHVRQIRTFRDAALDRKLEEVWGDLRESGTGKLELIAGLKSRLTPETLAGADRSQGRVLFNSLCSSCHMLYGQGQHLGPDLTGSGRHDVNYLIENLADPGALLPNEYKLTLLHLKDGRVLSGIPASVTERTITLRSIGQEQTVEKTAIASQEQLPVSLMPEGLLSALTEDQTRDLIAYLMHDGQVPLPKTD